MIGGGGLSRPKVTRLRFVSAKDPEEITEFLKALKRRVQVTGAPVKTGGLWYLWFIIGDGDKRDIPNTRLENV